MLRRKKPSPESKQKADYENLGKMLANIYETGYIDHNKAYKMSFLKGLASGLGGVIGATIVVGLLLWFLSFFQNIRFLDRVYDNLNSSLDSRSR